MRVVLLVTAAAGTDLAGGRDRELLSTELLHGLRTDVPGAFVQLAFEPVVERAVLDVEFVGERSRWWGGHALHRRSGRHLEVDDAAAEMIVVDPLRDAVVAVARHQQGKSETA